MNCGLDNHVKYNSTSGDEAFEELLFSMLPAILSNEKKRNKVKNLLTEMRMKDKSLCCRTTNGTSLWDIESNAVFL
jgi:hypothetical protein